MSSATDPGRSFHATDPATEAALQELHDFTNDVLAALDNTTRADDQVRDRTIRLYHLHREILEFITTGGNPGLFLSTTEKGAPEGVATLDANGLIPVEQLPSSLAGSGGSAMSTLITVERSGSIADAAVNIEPTGSGEVSYDINLAKTTLAIGSVARQPGRIYAEGRGLFNNQQPQYLNGANTPWIAFDEFGGVSGNVYDPAKWAAELDRLVDRGVNCTRVWIVCSCNNEGVTLDTDGMCNVPTSTFWMNVDDLVAKAGARGIFLQLTAASFDCFDWNRVGQERWVQMLGNSAALDSFISQYLVPLAERYMDNGWVCSIDLCNEMDWLYERGDMVTPRGGTVTPVGSGSRVVNFGQRLPDQAVGMQLIVNGVDLGLITERNSDTQATTTNPFVAASATFTVGVGNGWTFTGWPWAAIQRYLARASAAIHNTGSHVLVSMGQGTIKYGSNAYDGDHYADQTLAEITGDGASKLDIHSIHWYAWAQPWYRLLKSPTAHGLSAKPAIMAELPVHFADLNIPAMAQWKPGEYYSLNATPSRVRTGFAVRVDDGGFPRVYWLLTAGTSGNGPAPQGTGTIVDGGCVWLAVNNMYQPNHAYERYDMILADTANTAGIGRIYMCTTSGTTGNDGGPEGTGSAIALGTTVWEYVSDAIVDARTVYDYLAANGWCGHMPWMSNGPNNGFYETDLQGNYPIAWAPSEARYVNEMRKNGAGFYLCVTTGVTAASGGPTGTGADIIDGTVHWKWIKNISDPPWTAAGIDIKEFSDDNAAFVFPDISAPWNNRGTVVAQSKQRAWFPGGTVRFMPRFRMPSTLAQWEWAKVGPFDGTDGVYLKSAGGDLFLCVMKNGAEALVVSRDDWNVDKMDGTTESGLDIDVSEETTLVVDFAWRQGTKFGFLVDGVARWVHALADGEVRPLNPHLPLRWEIGSAQSINSVKTMELHSGEATASRSRAPRFLAWDNNASSTGVNASAVTEAFALRIAPGSVRWRTMRPVGIVIQSASVNPSGDYLFEWWLELNPTISNTPTWAPVPGSDCVEFARNRGISAAGRRIAGGYAHNATEHITLRDLPVLGEMGILEGDVLSLQIRNLSLAQDYYMHTITWDEG